MEEHLNMGNDPWALERTKTESIKNHPDWPKALESMEREKDGDYARFFQAAIKFVKFLSRHFPSSLSKPQIALVKTPEFYAWAHCGAIWITSGLLDKALACETFILKTHGPMMSGNRLLAPGNVFLHMGLWVIAHEYFHLSRGHLLMESPSKEVRQALEFDADCMASAGVFRFLRAILPQQFDDLYIKESLLLSVFFPIRWEIGSSLEGHEKEISTHPTWHMRLNYVCNKLGIMHYISHSRQTKFPPAYLEEMKMLWKRMLRCDVIYCHMMNTDRSKFMEFIKQEDASGWPEYRKLLGRWEAVEPQVKQHSTHFADR